MLKFTEMFNRIIFTIMAKNDVHVVPENKEWAVKLKIHAT
jgi:hypothetical protein